MIDQILMVIQGMNIAPAIALLAIAVFAVVWVLEKLGFLDSANLKRIGVLVGTFVTSEMVEEAEQLIVAVFVGVLAVLLSEFKKWAFKKVKTQ